eukprot:Skav213148  [mRNA]  locus=scaffold107:610791:614535:- [translate_table: standard]
MPSGLSSRKRRRTNFRRAVHVVVMALNFWWCGSSSIPLGLLKRTPSPSQRVLLKRVEGLMLADGPTECFDVLASGRRFPQLVARLSELTSCAVKLGVGAGPYERTYPGHSVPLDNTVLPELEPYKALQADRLKLVGRGHWDATPFLSPELCFAYRYPDSLLLDRIPEASEYPQWTDPVEEVGRLAKVWDRNGLLGLHRLDIQSTCPHELVRVFNAFKNLDCDRQIGDRRGRNSVEARVSGPSSRLPAGVSLLDLCLDASMQTLEICVTDRRDFYHQFAISKNRLLSNSVGPRVPLGLLRDTSALSAFAMASKVRSRKSRIHHGDDLGSHERTFPSCGEGLCMIAFNSIFQGDHAGVEIATSAHEGLLSQHGLLDHVSRLEAHRPFEGSTLAQGLVIDDYFAVAVVDAGRSVPGDAMKCLKKAKGAYEQEKIIGSDDKDVLGTCSGKVIGAQLNADPSTREKGHVLLSSPAEKRYSPKEPQLIRLRREVANELVLLAVLAPLCVSDLAAPFSSKVFATDASLEKGAICASPVSPLVSEAAWRSLRSKGGYSKLLDPVKSILARSLDFEECEGRPIPAGHAQGSLCMTSNVSRPLAYRFDFVEVFAGSASVTKHMKDLGFSVCCPIELSVDEELDMTKTHVMEWLAHLIQNRYVKGFMVEPPCTTFSVMRRPALRSREVPFGFEPLEEHTWLGNLLGHRGLQLLYLAQRAGVAGLLENPWSSKIKYLPSWRVVSQLPGVLWIRVDSCAYGSIHHKPFGLLGVWVRKLHLSGRCDRSHVHVKVQGAYTKKSASYTPKLALAFAKTIGDAIIALEHYDSELEGLEVQGLESQLVNELAISSSWSVESSWTFDRVCHINLLELSVVLRLVTRLARSSASMRVLVLVDSNVVRCAASKGRSSSRALSRLLTKIAAIAVAAGLFFVFCFVPTRLNVADDPTRDVPLRSPASSLGLQHWDRSQLYQLCNLRKTRRWAANWIRLRPSDFVVLGSFNVSETVVSLWTFEAYLCRSFPGLDFHSTLGFPGEGPSLGGGWFLGFWFILDVSLFGRCHGVLLPRNPGDSARLEARQLRPPLQEGRPVTGVTQQLRKGHLELFERWLWNQGLNLNDLLSDYASRVDEINSLLVKYGRALYAVGRPYNHFAETINSVAARKPVLRRQLQESWNLAFAWIRDEPPAHHIAMPWQVLLAAISVSGSIGCH